MPNSPAAKKALRQSEKRRLHNRSQRSTLRTAIKKVRAAIDAGDLETAKAAFQFAVKKLDQAAAKHLIHANKAARLKSRLNKLVREAVQAPATSGSE